jgi:hypothetical protein
MKPSPEQSTRGMLISMRLFRRQSPISKTSRSKSVSRNDEKLLNSFKITSPFLYGSSTKSYGVGIRLKIIYLFAEGSLQISKKLFVKFLISDFGP